MRRFLSKPIIETPQLNDLDKLKPTRIKKYLPIINPLWYIDQIKTINKQLTRAFSKPQLFKLCQQIQNQQQQQQQLKQLKQQLKQTQSKQSLIEFILFQHWQLTNPINIPIDQSFNSLIQKFTSNHQSHQLSYHELYLLQLERQTSNPINSLIDQLSISNHVTIDLSPEHQQLNILGQIKHRQRFWTQFETTRRTIYQQQIQLTNHQSIPFKNPILLHHLAKLSNCSFETNNNNLLVAHSFDQHNLTKRVSDLIQRYSNLATEYDHILTLIDLEPNPNRTHSKSLGFLPFSYPFQLDWPHHLTFDHKSLSRFSSPSNTNDLLQPTPTPTPTLPALDLLLESSFPVLTSLSSSDSITLHQSIITSFPITSTNQDESLECRVYQGYYVRSKDPVGPLLDQSLITLLPTDHNQSRILEQLRSFWNSNFSDSTDPSSPPTRKFIFLKSPRAPIESAILAKHQVEEKETGPSGKESTPRDDNKDGFSSMIYKLIPTSSTTSPCTLLDDQSGTTGNDRDGADSSDGKEEVWRKRVVILRPHQSTDLMVEVEKRKRVDLDLKLSPLSTASN